MLSIELVANSGDDLELLKALRQKLAKTLDESKSGRDIATLSRQLQIVMLEISEYEEKHKYDQGETVLDIVKENKRKRIRRQNQDIDEFIGDPETVLETVRKKTKKSRTTKNENI